MVFEMFLGFKNKKEAGNTEIIFWWVFGEAFFLEAELRGAKKCRSSASRRKKCQS